jgi:hypothetical protein
MDDRLIWTRADIVRFTRDASREIRSWAWGWLRRHHAEEAGRQAARGILDPCPSIALEALVAYEEHPLPEASRAIEELWGRDDLATSVRKAIDTLRRPGGRLNVPEPGVEEIERLSRATEELKSRAKAMILSKSFDDHLVAMSALGYQQHRWATDILLEHFVALLTSRDDTELWSTIDALRDPRFLPAILAAWVPGERNTARIYGIIHHLAGLTGPLPEGIARDLEDYAKYCNERDAFFEAHPDADWPGIRRPAACHACGRTGEYERAIPVLLYPFMPRDSKGKIRSLGKTGVMVCKFCGVRNPDRLVPLLPGDALRGARIDDEGEDNEGEDED